MEKSLTAETNIVYDDIVVGAGLAGSLLAFFLLQQNRKVLLMDKGQEQSSSSIAAGIINPITGKNFIKSWNIDVFLPVALSAYREIETFLGIKLIYQKNLIRSLATPGIENHWDSRKLDENYDAYVEKVPDITHFKNEINIKDRVAEIKEAYRIDIGLFITTFKKYMMDTDSFVEMELDYTMLDLSDNRVVYKNFRAQNIYFCEGYKGAVNPFFPNLDFALTRGQASVIQIEGSNINKMVKNEFFLVPLENENFWVGGGYNNITVEESFVDAKLENQEHIIEDIITGPYTMLSTKSAIRPTTKQRRVFLLQHQQYDQVYFFNGLGTKGSSMAPYYVNHLVAHIVSGKPLEGLKEF